MPTSDSKAAVLIVGSGFLGRHLAVSCAAGGHNVTVLTRHGRHSSPADAQVVIGDATDRALMRTLLASSPHVIWCAGSLLPSMPAGADPGVDLDPLRSTLSLQSESGGAITYFSSGGTVYGDHGARPASEEHPLSRWSPYSQAKIAAEHMLSSARASGTRSIVLRCGNVYGPAQQPGRSQGVVATALDCASAAGSAARVRRWVDGA